MATRRPTARGMELSWSYVQVDRPSALMSLASLASLALLAWPADRPSALMSLAMLALLAWPAQPDLLLAWPAQLDPIRHPRQPAELA